MGTVLLLSDIPNPIHLLSNHDTASAFTLPPSYLNILPEMNLL